MASKTMESKQPMKRLFQYLGKYKKSMWFAVCSSIVNKIFDLMPPFLTAWIIDSVSGNIPGWIEQFTGLTAVWNIILFLAGVSLFVHLGESLTQWLFQREFMHLAQDLQHDLRVEAYDKMQNREVAFFEEQRTGNLMSMLNNDINQLERFLNGSFNEIIQVITLFIFAGWALLSISPLLGMISMLPVPFIILGSFYYQRKVGPIYKRVRESVGALGNRLENNISGIAVIKSFTAEEFESKRVRESSQEYRKANYHSIFWNSLYIPIIRIFIAIGFTAVLLIGASWVIQDNGLMTLGGLAFFAMMIQRLLWPVTRLGKVFDEYERARASARRVFGLLDSQSAIVSVADNGESDFSHKSGIEIKGMDFYYHPEIPILKNINLTVPLGKTVGIAGPTVTGKTTLIKLLLRLYDVKEGGIFIGATDIRKIPLKRLRKMIGFVSQDVYLFHGTLEENIAYGMEHYQMEDVISAARRAELHDYIASLPNGYQSIIGERGIKLSGGQRQRLSIARAILKDAPILVLDEATSSVDTETERAIQKHLKELTLEKTAIIIAHRLSTIRQADKIIVLDKGSIAEEGRHEDLVAANGIYADLWNVQVGNF